MMKTQFLTLLTVALIAVACSNGGGDNANGETANAAPTACECVDHYNNKNEALMATCKELRADEAFEEEFRKCQAAAITGREPGEVNLVSGESMALEAPADGMYNFDGELCQVIWTGSKITGSTHTGTVGLKSGIIEITNGQISNCKVVLDMTTIANTDIEDAEKKGNLEGHLMSDDFFGVETFPEAWFTFTSGEMANGKGELVGDLTMKDITKPATANVFFTKSGEDVAVVTGTMMVNRANHDVRYGSGSFFDDLGDNMINDEIMLKFQLKAIRN